MEGLQVDHGLLMELLGRTGDSGNTDLTMWLEIDHSGGMIATQPFSVTFVPSTTQQAWSTSLTMI